MSGETFKNLYRLDNLSTPGGQRFPSRGEFWRSRGMYVEPADAVVFDLITRSYRVYPNTTPYALISTNLDFATIDPGYDVAVYSSDTRLFNVGPDEEAVNADDAITFVGIFAYGAFIDAGTGGSGTPTDTDGDGVPDSNDNCPGIANRDQANNDNDAQGDVCDADDDNDGLTDADETGIYGTSPWLSDTDGDGLSDPAELGAGTDPNNPDTDGDGTSDGDELAQGRNPLLNEGAIPGIIDAILLND